MVYVHGWDAVMLGEASPMKTEPVVEMETLAKPSTNGTGGLSRDCPGPGVWLVVDTYSIGGTDEPFKLGWLHTLAEI
jgi:hypothetical protein